jgi:hypothetical protein
VYQAVGWKIISPLNIILDCDKMHATWKVKE